MALADIQIYDEGSFGYKGEVQYAVQAGGTPPAINAGEPVAKALGAGQYVTALATSKPVVGTDYLAGVAGSTSTESTSVDGTVNVMKMSADQSFLIAPKTASTYFGSGSTPSQSTYNSLIGARVTLDLTSGVYTINGTDGSTNGCVVLPLDIVRYPGKVRFGFRNGTNYLA